MWKRAGFGENGSAGVVKVGGRMWREDDWVGAGEEVGQVQKSSKDTQEVSSKLRDEYRDRWVVLQARQGDASLRCDYAASTTGA